MPGLPSILPQPTSLSLRPETWRGGDTLTLSFDPGLERQASLLAEYLKNENQVTTQAAAGGALHLSLALPPHPLPANQAAAGFMDEAYRLTVTPENILIEGASPAGVACGIQSLRQLLSGQRAPLTLPALVVEDRPAMAWRGLHLDVSRHFRTAEDVRRFIDLAALHKFNVFHWHLTDDQGWRLPVEGYPRLTETAAWRDGTLIGHQDQPPQERYDGVRHGGYYTHEEIRGVVDYAAARGIHVLPEVDLPGHVQALVTAYPEFGNSGQAPGVRQRWGISPHTLNLEPATFAFLERLVDTVAGLFPFHYLHFGGDEALVGEWEASPRIQEHKRALGLPDDHAVQGYFTRRIHEMATRHGRAMIGWDEIIERNEPPHEVAVMSWRDSYKLATPPHLKALQGRHPLVLASCSTTYFDAYQAEGEAKAREPLAIGSFISWEKVYAWQPLADIPAAQQAGLLGAQAQLWAEYIPTCAHLDYMTYPRACALAQVLWTGTAREPLAAFRPRLEHHLARLGRLGVSYRPLSP